MVSAPLKLAQEYFLADTKYVNTENDNLLQT
jgi:hypothetical protein